MATLAEIREKYPVYADRSDEELADAIYRKFYANRSDGRTISREDFNRKIGLTPANEPESPTPPSAEQQAQITEVEQRAGQREAIRDSLIDQAPAEPPADPGMGVVEATATAIGNVPDRWAQSGAGLRQGSAEARIAQVERAVEAFDSSNLYGERYNGEIAGAFEAFAEANGLIDADITDPTERARALAPLADNLTPEQRTAFRDFYAAQYEQSAEQAAGDFEAAGERQTPVDTEPGSAAYYVSAIAGSLGEMGPAFVASFVTGNPLPAMAGIGALVGGQSYGEGRAEGLSPEDAGNRALLMAAAEGIPEAVPLHVLLKPGSAFFKRMMQAGITEAGQEMITEALQIGIDTNYLGPDMTWGEVAGRIADAGIIGAGAGATLAVGAHGVEKAKGALPSEDPGKTIGREMGRQLAESSMAARIDAHLWDKGVDPAPQASAPPQPEAPFDP